MGCSGQPCAREGPTSYFQILLPILYVTGHVRFIDYEYAGYNYQAFDIGNHFNEFAGERGSAGVPMFKSP